jgi:HEPN domain-containing protein
MTNHEASRHDFARATVILNEARSLAGAGHHNLVVRRAQEAVELALKGCLRWAGIEVPRVHDVGPFLKDSAYRFPAAFRQLIPDLASISRSLKVERETSFYGDPETGLPPEDLYSARDAADALGKADTVLEACSLLKTDLN